MKLSYIENLLFKAALKKKNKFSNIIFITSEILFLSLSLIALFYLIKTGRDIFFYIMLLCAIVALDIFSTTTYQNIVRKIYKP